jgi:hypothetical protein
VIHTPFYDDFEIQPAARAITLEGCADLLKVGLHREIVPFLLFVRTAAQNALWNDGSDDEKECSMLRYRALLSDIGIDRGIFEERRMRARALSEELLAVADEIIRRSPSIRH